MKKIFFVFTILFYFAIVVKAQSNAASPEEIKAAKNEPIFSRTEQEASFKGGEEVLNNYLAFNLNKNIPKINGAPAGTYIVIIRFIVHKSGRISDVVPETKHGYGMEQEAMRIINTGPKWLPAIQNGNIVTAYKRQPITFLVE
jgi:periplasmic protein TonB